jgi:hypothetical protein
MPLLKGEKNIGHNIKEMEEHGHPHKQAVAAALSTAYDDLNTQSKRQAQREGATMSHDEPYARPVTSMTQSDLNEANKKYWGGEAGNIGPAETEAKAPMLAGTKVVPVYRGAGDQDEKFDDEVSPTQSDPPDSRSNNLLGMPAIAGDAKEDPQGYGSGRQPAGYKPAGSKYNTMNPPPKDPKPAKDDMVEGSEAMEANDAKTPFLSQEKSQLEAHHTKLLGQGYRWRQSAGVTGSKEIRHEYSHKSGAKAKIIESPTGQHRFEGGE